MTQYSKKTFLYFLYIPYCNYAKGSWVWGRGLKWYLLYVNRYRDYMVLRLGWYGVKLGLRVNGFMGIY